jgi:hypothetical protein
MLPSASQLLISFVLIGVSVAIYSVCVRLVMAGRLSRRAAAITAGVSTGIALWLVGATYGISLGIALAGAILCGAAIGAGVHAGLGSLLENAGRDGGSKTHGPTTVPRDSGRG